MATRDAVIDVAYSVGALVNAVQQLIKAVESLKQGVTLGQDDFGTSMAEVDTALLEAKRTSDASIHSVVHVLRAFGERPPNER